MQSLHRKNQTAKMNLLPFGGSNYDDYERRYKEQFYYPTTTEILKPTNIEFPTAPTAPTFNEIAWAPKRRGRKAKAFNNDVQAFTTGFPTFNINPQQQLAADVKKLEQQVQGLEYRLKYYEQRNAELLQERDTYSLLYQTQLKEFKDYKNDLSRTLEDVSKLQGLMNSSQSVFKIFTDAISHFTRFIQPTTAPAVTYGISSFASPFASYGTKKKPVVNKKVALIRIAYDNTNRKNQECAHLLSSTLATHKDLIQTECNATLFFALGEETDDDALSSAEKLTICVSFITTRVEPSDASYYEKVSGRKVLVAGKLCGKGTILPKKPVGNPKIDAMLYMTKDGQVHEENSVEELVKAVSSLIL